MSQPPSYAVRCMLIGIVLKFGPCVGIIAEDGGVCLRLKPRLASWLADSDNVGLDEDKHNHQHQQQQQQQQHRLADVGAYMSYWSCILNVNCVGLN